MYCLVGDAELQEGSCEEAYGLIQDLGLENITDKNYLVHGSGVFGTGFTARWGYSFIR